MPELWARRGAEAARGTASFLKTDLPEVLQAQGLGDVESSLAARWRRAHASALSAVEAFAAWQETELLPRARGDYRLGRERLQRKLLYGEHVTLSIEHLREMNEAAIRDYKERVRKEAARIDPGATPEAVMEAMSRDFLRPTSWSTPTLDTASRWPPGTASDLGGARRRYLSLTSRSNHRPQQRLYFFPEPQGHGPLRLGVGVETAGPSRSEDKNRGSSRDTRRINLRRARSSSRIEESPSSLSPNGRSRAS